MKAKTLSILAGITFVVIVAAVLMNQETTKPLSQNSALVFPDLMSKINDVTELTVQSKEETVTLVRQESTWGIKEKEGYPAALEKVKRSLIGIAELRYREPKTKNPDLYGKLGLLDQNQEGSTSTLVSVRTEANQDAAKLLIGDQRPAKGNPGLSEIFVRKPDDPQTWLVTGKLPFEKTATEWLDKDILNVTGTRVHRVRVMHPDGESLTVEKKSPADLDYHIADMPKGFKVQSQFNVNNVVTTISKLSVDDVKKREALDAEAKPGVKAVLETFDGLQVTVQTVKTVKTDETIYGKVSAAFDPSLVYKVEEPDEPISQVDETDKKDQGQEAKAETSTSATPTGEESGDTGETEDQDKESPKPPKPEIKPAEEVKKEVTTMNLKLGGWVFELPKFRVDNFSKKKKDLITKES